MGSSPKSKTSPTGRQYLVVLTCALAGLWLDQLSLPYLGEFDLPLRLFPVFLTGLAYGPAPAAVAAALASSRLLLGGDALGYLLALLEATLVATLPRRRVPALVGVLVFWLLIHGPVHFLRAVAPTEGALVAAGLLVAGILGISLAELLLSLGWARTWLQPLAPYHRRRPLRAILVHTFILMGALPPLIVAAIGGHNDADNRRREAGLQLESLARTLGERLDEAIDHHRRTLMAAAGELDRASLTSGPLLVSRLDRIRQLHPGFLTLLVADADGRLLATMPELDPQGRSPVANGDQVADREYFRIAMSSGQPFVSGIFAGRGLGQDPIVAVATPIFDNARQPAGIVEGSLHLSWLRQLVDREAHSERVLILDRDSRVVVAGPQPWIPVLTELGSSPLVRRVASAGAGFELEAGAAAPLCEEACLTGQSLAPELGWRVLVARPLVAIGMEAKLLFLRSLAWALLLTGAGVAVISRIAWHVTRPLARLATAQANLAASRNRPQLAESSPSGPREIALLESSFRQVSAVLADSYAALRTTVDERAYLNAQLEKLLAEREIKVFERTAQLASATAVAERHARAKSNFLAHMSHEIRTPLNAVIGISDSLLASRLNAEQREGAAALRASAEALLAVVNDTLDLAKIEAGHFELSPQAVDLRELIDDSLLLFAAKAAEKNLELIADIAPEIPARMVVDGQRLRQVLLNLLANSLRFTARGAIEVLLDPSAEGFRLEVRDTGIGIPEEALGRLFTPYDQLDIGADQASGGTGLGLAIASSLAEAMGGHIECTSVVGQGSVFAVSLPAAAGGELPPPPIGGKRLLVAASSPLLRRVLERQLRAWQAEVVAIASFTEPETAAAIATAPFDLALVEPNLPGAYRFAAAWPAAGHLAVLVPLGAQLEPEWHDLALPRLGKPLRSHALLDFLAGRAWRAPAETGSPAGGESLSTLSTLPGVPRLLAVDDNPVNLAVLNEQLRRRGFLVDLAAGGEEALARMGATAYALALVDARMPGLDGLALTRARRAREAAAGLSRLPIIAFTANAGVGDREACLAAGMDDYLTKPLRPAELDRVLAEWLPAPAGNQGKSLDAEALSRVDDPKDSSFLAELVEIFLTDCPARLAELATAAQQGNAAAAANAAHGLKSGAANLGALNLASLAQQICDHPQTPGGNLGERVAALVGEYFRVTAALRQQVAGRR